ncbi:flagellar hook protein FlgE [Fodinibius salsisoli]|uniref:Flagellar hook protein FlgE n=1 Tax=Fodinibius salsisoli TaxID=2820877 RepID=A0ABT3PHI4_9BACT|nr:flagellar hook protein FlgE [Fodinibius salsisoli]MCW9705372.1 flagellar hook protein FlgE [Fodinibius salsisoli]
MSLIKSLNSGVSGLKSFQTKMDTIGNNIANVDTNGFKSSRVTFSELMNENIGGAGGGESAPSQSNQVGLGVRVASVDRDFSSGTIENTGKTTDLAIEGDGYFVVNNGSQDLMTRAGNFTFNKNGQLVDQAGNFVQGYNANDSGNILGGGATDNVRVDFENVLEPKQTSEVNLGGNLDASTSSRQIVSSQSAFTDDSGNLAGGSTDINDLSQTAEDLEATDVIEVSYTQNDGTAATADFEYGTDGTTLNDMVSALNSDISGEGEFALVDGMLRLKSDTVGDSELNVDSVAITDGSGDGTDSVNFPGFKVSQEGDTGTQTMSTTVYDGLGNEHSLLVDFTQTGEGQWDYEAKFADGESITGGSATGTINFDEAGQIDGNSNFNIEFDPSNGGSNVNFNVSLGGSEGTDFTQYSGANTAKVLNQDGYTQGSLVDVRINGDGRVQGVYDNGENQDLAQLALGDVQNEDGLEMVGGGLFRATSAAGEVFVDGADNVANSNIRSGALEGSNVDLAQQFTEMITSQRAYQSSARVISTSDEMLTEAVNLKR